MKVVYIDYGRSDSISGSSGIDRKKLAQIKELEKLGEVTRVSLYDPSPLTLWKKIMCRLPFFPSLLSYDYTAEFNNSDVVYMRRSYTDRFTIRLLKKIRKNNPNCIIFFEIPTYPYDNEMQGTLYPFLLKERWNRRYLHKYVDSVVLVVATEPIVFGIPTLTIINGIDFSTVLLRKIPEDSPREIHAIIIGNFEFWHGLDRLIAGMSNYYRSGKSHRTFILHVVGPTDHIFQEDRDQLDELIQNGFIKLYGELSFDDVEDVYDKMTVALDVFGMHRVGPDIISSSIKSREYGAKGLPIVSESRIDYISDSSPYFLRVPDDDSPVSIETIIAFHDDVYTESAHVVAQKIRTYAERTCSSQVMMQPVLEFVHQNSKTVR